MRHSMAGSSSSLKSRLSDAVFLVSSLLRIALLIIQLANCFNDNKITIKY